MKWQLALLCFLSISAAKAADVIPFGEDLSMTSYILKSHQCTAGFQDLGCGITDDLMLATDPWLIDSYNTFNLGVRFHVGDQKPDVETTMQLAYFRSFHTSSASLTGENHSYQMEFWWLYYVRSYKMTSDYTVHLNAQAMYFLDDYWPLSLRRPWGDRSPWQFNATALNEVHLIGGHYVNAEFGVLGFTQQHPEFVLGLSYEYRLLQWLFHFGVTQTGTGEAYTTPQRRNDVQTNLLDRKQGFGAPYDSGKMIYDYAIHPEMAIQYYF